MPEVKYQIFIGSTYEDLKIERREVIDTILDLHHFPIGMEMFGASASDSWTLIEKAIRQSDCYLLIIAGRYGTLAPDGKSWTEKEFDFALAEGTPVIAFLHEDPGSISFDKSDSGDLRVQLEAFIAKAKDGRNVSRWSNADQLAARVSSSLSKHEWAEDAGWVRLRDMGTVNRTEPDDSEQEIGFPSDEELVVKFSWYRSVGIDAAGVPGSITLRLEDIFYSLGRNLTSAVSERRILGLLCRLIESSPLLETRGVDRRDVTVRSSDEFVQSIKFKFLGRKLIELPDVAPKTGTVWKLSEKGMNLLIQREADLDKEMDDIECF